MGKKLFQRWMVIGLAVLSVPLARAEEMTCLGDRENTMAAVSRIVDQVECTQFDSISMCREAVAVGAAFASVAGVKAIRSALRAKMISFCALGNAGLESEFFHWLFGFKVANALPPTRCDPKAQQVNHAFSQFLNEAEKGLEEDLAERRTHIDAAKTRLQIRLDADNAAKIYAQLDNELARNPEKFLGPKYLSKDKQGKIYVNEDGREFLKEKRAQIQKFLKEYDSKSGLELREYLGEKGLEIQKGLAARPDVVQFLDRKLPSELAEEIKKADRLSGLERVRRYEELARKYPQLRDMAQVQRSIFQFEFEVSQFKSEAMRARAMPVKTIDDVMAKYNSIRAPAQIDSAIARRSVQRLTSLRHAVVQNMQKAGTAARTAASRFGTRTLATKALVFFSSAPVFAADLALSPSDAACADFRYGRYATTATGGCDIVDEIGPPTRELLLTKEDDEIFEEIKNNKQFCESLARYHSRANFTGWKAQCTDRGFKLKSTRSKTYLTYIFHTRDDGTVRLGERAEAGQRTINMRFDENEKLLPVTERPEVNDEFRAMNLAVATAQGCCYNYHNMDKDHCARFGVSSPPSGSRAGAPSSGGSSGSAKSAR